MAGSNMSKIKLLHIQRILNELSDEEHPLTSGDIISELSKVGISAERKSIYSDIAVLQEYGVDIIKVQDGTKGYFVGEREFEFAEVRLLIDAVQTAKFISKAKSIELIDKLRGLSSKYLADTLMRTISIDDAVKCDNKEFYYNVDKIHGAIANGKMISFQYAKYDLNKQRVLEKEGREYKVSPYELIWFEEHYYLIGNHSKYHNLSHYRLDRMQNVVILDEAIRPIDEVENCQEEFNIADYLKKSFNMHAGNDERVELRFKNSMINKVIDKFGLDIEIVKDGEEHFKIESDVIVSEGFISWVLSLGDDVQVVGPDKLREKIKDKVTRVFELYSC